MVGSNDPLGGPRRRSRPPTSSSLAAARNAALTRIDLVLPSDINSSTPVRTTSAARGITGSSAVRGDPPSSSATRARYDAEGSTLSLGGGGRPTINPGWLEGRYAVARDFQASVGEEGRVSSDQRSGGTSAAPAAAAAAHVAVGRRIDSSPASQSTQPSASTFTLLPTLGRRRYAHTLPTSASIYDASVGVVPPLGTSRTETSGPQRVSTPRTGNGGGPSVSPMQPESTTVPQVAPFREVTALSPRGGSADRLGRRVPLGRAPVRRGVRSEGRARSDETWGEPVAAFADTVGSRVGRDSTALRAVSARLDAAATAIDAVEVGVRSASDSLDSLLHLLESRPAAMRSRSALDAAAAARGSGSEADRPAWLVAPVGVSWDPSSLISRSVPSISHSTVAAAHSAGEPTATVRSALLTELGMEGEAFLNNVDAERAIDEGERLRVASLLRTESDSMGSVHQRVTEEGVDPGVGRRLVVTPRRSATEPATVPAPAAGVAAETRLPTMGGSSMNACRGPRSTRASAGEEGVRVGRTAPEEYENGTRGRTDVPATAGRREFDRSWRAETVPRSDDRSVSEAAAAGGTDLRLSGRASPRGTGTDGATGLEPAGAAGAVTVDANRGSRRLPSGGDASFPARELEAAMESIDEERGRLMLEIAHLRGQQNQSLLHLLRLQQEQYFVRQRQVSTLSDIVNSFGRTVEAAGALPHGEDSSLGRISGDVVSTLRRMLCLLSATVPAAIAAPLNDRPRPTTLSPPALGASTPSPRRSALSDVVIRRGSAREGSANGPGTYAVGGRVALRPAEDLTQDVIDAALQALPRLAAAASAISGARRLQGFLDGAGGADGASADGAEGHDTVRRCSAETIAALPDAPKAGVGDGVDPSGVGGCVICLSEGDKEGKLLCHLPCDHVFHRVCVGKWLRVQASCPTCRAQVPDVEVGSTPAPEVV